MHGRLKIGAMFALGIGIAVAMWSAQTKWIEHQHQKFYETTLISYRAALTSGMQRKQVEDYLQGKHISFFGFPAYSDDSSYAELIKIGEEKGGWYCGPASVYVAIEFETATDRRVLEDPSDTLTKISLFTYSDDCM
jgi:hypothetical protein